MEPISIQLVLCPDSPNQLRLWGNLESSEGLLQHWNGDRRRLGKQEGDRGVGRRGRYLIHNWNRDTTESGVTHG